MNQVLYMEMREEVAYRDATPKAKLAFIRKTSCILCTFVIRVTYFIFQLYDKVRYINMVTVEFHPRGIPPTELHPMGKRRRYYLGLG